MPCGVTGRRRTRPTPCRRRSASCAAPSGRRRSSPAKPAMPLRSVPMRSTSSASSSWWRKDDGWPPTARWRRASAALGEALGLRRGEPLAEFNYAGFFDTERAHLGELTLVAIEARAGADLGLGRHGELAGELEARCREPPLREGLWELLILALYRAGRQAEALRAYTEIRDRLVSELGIDPGPALRELQARILAQDPSLARASAPADPAPVRAAAPTAAGNLRERLSSFVGRDAELEQLREAVRSSRLVTLTGPGGTGKTRLAVEAAAALRAEYQDGAWLVELAGVAAPPRGGAGRGERESKP